MTDKRYSILLQRQINANELKMIGTERIPTLGTEYIQTGQFPFNRISGFPTGYSFQGVGTEVSPTYSQNLVCFDYVISGLGTVIPSGSAGFLEIPHDFIAEKITILGDTTGSLIFNVKKGIFASYPLTSVVATIALNNVSSFQGTLSDVILKDNLVEYALLQTASINKATVSLKGMKV